MAVTTLPSIRTTVAGENITALDSLTSFTLTEKAEIVQYLKAADGKVAVNLSVIDTIKSILFHSDGVYTVEVTITPLVEPTTPITIPFEVSGMFRLDPTVAFRGLITSITLSTASVTNITVDTRIYGTVAPVV